MCKPKDSKQRDYGEAAISHRQSRAHREAARASASESTNCYLPPDISAVRFRAARIAASQKRYYAKAREDGLSL